jgi:integrase
VNAPVLFNLEHLTDRDNGDGTKRYYFRRRGQPLARLPGEPLSLEFMTAYRKCMDWTAPHAVATEGTFAWICDQYMDSPAFTSKAKATQDARRRVIATMVAEPLDPDQPEKFGAEKAKNLTADHIEVLRDRKASNPNAGNERLKILGQIFKLAKSRKWVAANIVIGTERLGVPKGGHRTATDADIAQYFAKHTKGPAWVAGMILRHLGVRVSDLRVLGRQHVRKGRVTFETVKTGVLCELPIDPELATALPRDNMTFLLSEAGKPFESDKALSQRVSKWFRQAGVVGITAHSVRKWLATKMAEDGSTEYELMSWFGWKDPKEARPYVQAANRQKMAQAAFDKRTSV